jgi:hypothetical protein
MPPVAGIVTIRGELSEEIPFGVKQEPNPLITELSKHLFSIDNGVLNLPDAPGLGIEINSEAIEKYESKPIRKCSLAPRRTNSRYPSSGSE